MTELQAVNFNSTEFLVLFLPTVFLLFYAVPMRLRLWILVIASLLFYGISGIEVLVAFVIAIVWSYMAAFLIGKRRKLLQTIVAISVPCLFLFLFKYLNFFLTIVHIQPPPQSDVWLFSNALLPAGISFYTFELVSYSLDVADGRIAADRDLLRFTSFATFFPHLIAGPIMRYANLRDQLRVLQNTEALKPRIVSGLKLLSVGLFCKVFVADVSGMMVEKANGVPFEQLTAVDQLAKIGFWSMQIYYDFWAYSVMAIGLGRLFCIELPINFRQPYLSANPREFWQRWHITLSYWLRDYVYIRMGGREFYVRNILTVFALVGLWHGAAWNFVLWGVYHAGLVILYHLTRPAWDRLPKWAAIAVTFLFVSFGWPLFFIDIEHYVYFMCHLVVAPWHLAIYKPLQWLYLAAIGIVTFAVPEELWLYNDPDRHNIVSDSPLLAAIALFVGLLFISLSRTFIYFRF
jgi:alginate O-acetyltransferase complex protein AlgI